ncbi:MAG: hypothetical protein ACRD01_16590 [Terriglobales bacterium]
MPTLSDMKRLPAELRRRNRRLGWALAVMVVAISLWTFWPVHHGWIYPEDTTYAFPHWMKK